MSSSKILMVGAGLVWRLTIEILSRDGVRVTVACRTLKNAEKLVEGLSNTMPTPLGVSDENALGAQDVLWSR